jgi:hypothetical protein
MKRLLLMVTLLLAGGLAGAADQAGESMSSEIEPWTVAPAQYTCTSEQRANLEAEDRFCTANTDYTKEYCYGIAFIRNCSKRLAKAPPAG